MAETAAARAAGDQVVERRALGGHARPARVPARGPQLQLELVGQLEAPVRGQQRVARRVAGVVDERVQLGHAPAEHEGGGEGCLGRDLMPRQSAGRWRLIRR